MEILGLLAMIVGVPLFIHTVYWLSHKRPKTENEHSKNTKSFNETHTPETLEDFEKAYGLPITPKEEFEKAYAVDTPVRLEVNPTVSTKNVSNPKKHKDTILSTKVIVIVCLTATVIFIAVTFNWRADSIGELLLLGLLFYASPMVALYLVDFIVRKAKAAKKKYQSFTVTKKNNDEADVLLKYKALLDDGAITQEEYDRKKKDILHFNQS